MLYVFKNNLLYKSHLLLHLKNKTLLTIFLQFSFVLLYTYTYDTNHTYCMIGNDDAETSSAYGDPEDKYLKKARKSLFQEILETSHSSHESNITVADPVENALGPMFEYLKNYNSKYDETTFENSPLLNKIHVLEHTYFNESAERIALSHICEEQADSLTTYHNSSLDSQNKIKELIYENMELQNQVDELQRLLEEALKK